MKTSSDEDLSTKDKILVTPAVLSGLLCIGLSFGLHQSLYRNRFFIALAVFLSCLFIADNRRVLLLAFVLFFAIRSIWSVILLIANH